MAVNLEIIFFVTHISRRLHKDNFNILRFIIILLTTDWQANQQEEYHNIDDLPNAPSQDLFGINL